MSENKTYSGFWGKPKISHLPSEDTDRKILRLAILLAAIALNFAIAIFSTQLFTDKYPLGMDTFSHLPKVFYLYENGPVAWFFDWYAGMPLFLFYPPLSYMIAYLPTLMGLDPTLSYKLTETAFLMATPFLIYLLARRMGIPPVKAACATLIFSLLPPVVLNPALFGRFPNIVALPFFLATLICTLDVIAANSSKRKLKTLLAGIFFALTLLSHHLSAYILTLLLAVLILNLLLEKEHIKSKVRRVFSVGSPLLIGLICSSFWLIPFILYLKYWHQTLIDTSSIHYIPVATVICGATILLLSWVTDRFIKPKDFYGRVIVVWSILFSLYGAYYIPADLLLPAGGQLDLLRFQLYASPAYAFLFTKKFSFARLRIGFPSFLQGRNLLKGLSVITVLMLVLNMFIGALIFVSMPDVVAREVHVGKPPQPIIDYLNERECFGRVMAIGCPFWVYLLPYYTDKRLIDGWYPQGSILVMLKKIDKHHTLNNCEDEKLLKHFIENAEEYGIKWVLLGDESKRYLLEGSGFKPVLSSDGIILYENSKPVSYIDVEPTAEVSYSWGKDEIKIWLHTEAEETRLIVKEAYFPAWKAYDNGVEIPLQKSELGFMKLTVKGEGSHIIRIVFTEVGEEAIQKAKKEIENLKEKTETVTRTLRKLADELQRVEKLNQK